MAHNTHQDIHSFPTRRSSDLSPQHGVVQQRHAQYDREQVEEPVVPRRGDPELAESEQGARGDRSEEHTSELHSPDHLVCRLLLEKKKKKYKREYERPVICDK